MSIARRPTSLTSPTAPPPADAARRRVVLAPAADGWTLVTTDGRVLHRARGRASRHECLRYARDAGILSIVT